MQQGDMYEQLAEGERKAVARSTEVARRVVADPSLLPCLIDFLLSENTIVVSHAAHALLTVSKRHINLLEPHKGELISVLSSEQWEVQEQLGKILPRLSLDKPQQVTVWERFQDIFYNGTSSIARTCALQALVDMGTNAEAYRGKAGKVIAYALENGSKAMQARARNLLKDIEWIPASR